MAVFSHFRLISKGTEIEQVLVNYINETNEKVLF